MKNIILFLLLLIFSAASFSQQTITHADTSKTRLTSQFSSSNISRLYNPLTYSYSLVTRDMKNYEKNSRPYYRNTDQTQSILFLAGHILVSIVSNKLGYRYDPYSH